MTVKLWTFDVFDRKLVLILKITSRLNWLVNLEYENGYCIASASSNSISALFSYLRRDLREILNVIRYTNLFNLRQDANPTGKLVIWRIRREKLFFGSRLS